MKRWLLLGGFGYVCLLGVGGMVVLGLVCSSAGRLTPPAPRAASTYEPVDVRDLDKNPDAFRDMPLVLSGEVFSIRESFGVTQLQMFVAFTGASDFESIAVVVVYGGSLPDVYEGSAIAVYGRGDGTASGTNALGGAVSQPKIMADRIELAP